MLLEDNKKWTSTLPSYLIGASVLFWGIMVEQLLFGVILAIVVEGYNFTKTRWNFTYDNYVRAWHLSIIFAILDWSLYWLDGYKLTQMRVMFEWLPLLLSPIIFVQRYGKDFTIPLNTFSFVARRRMKADIREGRKIDPLMVDFSLPYFGMCLLSAGLVKRSANFWDIFSINISLFYGAGIALLLGIYLFVLCLRKSQSKLIFMLVYAMLLFGSSFVFTNLVNLDQRFRGGVSIEDDIDIEESHTKIGNLTDLKMSKKVVWRMWVPEEKIAPARVPLAVFDHYKKGTWFIGHTKSKYDAQRITNATIQFRGEKQFFVFNQNQQKWKIEQSKKETFRFLSTMNRNKPYATLPHLAGYVAYGDIVGEEASLGSNRLGSVRIDNPEATLHCKIWIGNQEKAEDKASPADLRVPYKEKEAIKKVCQDLKLKNLSDSQKVEALRYFFSTEFSYTTHLEIKEQGDSNYSVDMRRAKSPLTRFIEEVRKGHCEYFATASTLILREAGIPARYVTGYVTGKEKRAGAYLLRGNQAHAWTKAYIDGKWIDVDLTPADWQERDFAGSPSIQDQLSDLWKIWREDFQVWRSSPENAKTVNNSVLGLAGLLVIWIFIRLLFAKNKQNKEAKKNQLSVPPWKIMRKFNRWCSKKIGARPCGMPYALWVSELTKKDSSYQPLVVQFEHHYQAARFNKADAKKVEQCAKELMKLKINKSKIAQT